MTLTEAIRALVEAKGLSILTSPMVLNILSDYNAFNEYPSSKNVLKNIISEGYLEKIAFFYDNQLPLGDAPKNYLSELYMKLGLRQDVSAFVLNSIFDALGFGEILPSQPVPASNSAPAAPSTQSSNARIPKTSASNLNLTYSQLENKSDSFRHKYANEAENYLDGIVSILGNPNQELGVSLSANVAFSGDYNSFDINLEFEGGIKCKFQYNLVFIIVLKSPKGKIISKEEIYLDKNEVKQTYFVKSVQIVEDEFHRVCDIGEIKIYWKKD